MADIKYPQLQSFTLYASGASAGDTSIVLSSMKDVDGTQLAMSDFGPKGFITLEPGNGSQEEQISFTGLSLNSDGTTVTLSGVSSVTLKSPYTETSGLAKQHSGGSTAVVAVTSGLLATFANKGNDETVTGTWTFTTATRPKISADSDTTTNAELISYGQLYRTSISGAVDADTTHKGISEEATSSELTSASQTGGTGARLFANPNTLAKQIQTNSWLFATEDGTGSDDTYTCAMTPTLSGLTTGMVICVKITVANTGACTLNVDSLGAKNIKKYANGALADLETGDIIANQMCIFAYDGTQFIILNPPASVASGSIITEMTNFFSTTTITGAQADELIGGGNTLLHLHNYAATASDTLKASADTERTEAGLTYTKKKEISIYGLQGGTIRVKFDYSADTTTGYFQVYFNGTAVGTEKTTSGAYATWSEDLTISTTTFKTPLSVQLYSKASGGATAKMRNFRIYYDKTSKSEQDVVTD